MKTKLSYLWERTEGEEVYVSLKPRYNSNSQHMVNVSDKIVIYEKFCALPIFAGICGLFVYFWLHSCISFRYPRQSSVNRQCPQLGSINRTNRSRWPRLARSLTSLQSLYKVQLQYKWGQFKIYKLLLLTVRKKGKCKLETGARKFFLPEIGSIKTVYGRVLFWWSYQAEVSHFPSLSASPYQNVSRELTVDSWQSISVSKFPTVLYSPAPVGAKNAEQSHYQVV